MSTSATQPSPVIEPLPASEPATPPLFGKVLLLTLGIGLATTALLFRHFVAVDELRLQQNVQRATQALVDGARQATYMTPMLDVLSGTFADIQREVAAGAAVDAGLLQRHLWLEPPPGLETTTLEYLPRITAAELADPRLLRQRFGNSENTGFPLLDRVGSELRPASPRSDHFPVLFEATREAPRANIGFDPSGDPLMALAMAQARDTGALASYTHFPMARSDDMLITRYLYPLYATAQPPPTPDERREQLVGYLSAVSYLSAEAMLPFLPESYQGIETGFLPLLELAAPLPDVPRNLVWSSHEMEGQALAVVARPSPALAKAMVEPTRWWTLGLGLLLTAWMSSIVLWSNHQKRRIIRVVAQRTHDLAERTRSLGEANAALRDSETRYRMLANNISDVVYTHDMEGICTYISPSIKVQLGHDERDWLGQPVYAHLLPESAERTRSAIRRTVRAWRSGKSLQLGTHPHELEARCKDGSTKPVEVTISGVYDDSGELLAFMGVMRDVSARKEAERERERLQQAYRQAQKMEAIGTLAGGIAHDFNNLLTAVIGHADLLKLEFAERADAHHSLDVIEMAAMRAKDLTSQLLGFARKGQYQRIPVELNQVLAEVINLVERTVDRNIVIRRSPHPDNPMVLGDPGQISQIFLNLALNARDAMPQGGSLTFDIAGTAVDVDFCQTHPELEPGTYWVATVSDTGIGIAPDKLEHIFEPFFTDKPDGQGTGLGLAMVYGVTRTHNGTVLVDSSPDEGSRFHVYLPAATLPPLPVRQAVPRTLAQGSGHVLLIDDQDIVRQIGRRMLQQLGYRVSLAEDGVKGLALYREQWLDIDLVIIDIIMPNMGGLDCLEALREINPGVKAVLASGFSRDSIADRIKEQQILGFLQKPFRLQELSDLLAALQH